MPDVIHPTATTLRETSSADLAAAAGKGDVTAFEELVSRYRKRAYHAAFKILRNEEDAEDAVQDALVNAYCKVSTFRGDSAFSTWLTRIAMNTALMQIRRRKARFSVSLDELIGGDTLLSDAIASQSPSPEIVCVQRDLTTRMRKTLEGLSPTLKEITRDRLERDESIGNIAKKQGITISAAKSRLLRAKLAISARMLEAGATSPFA